MSVLAVIASGLDFHSPIPDMFADTSDGMDLARARAQEYMEHAGPWYEYDDAEPRIVESWEGGSVLRGDSFIFIARLSVAE